MQDEPCRGSPKSNWELVAAPVSCSSWLARNACAQLLGFDLARGMRSSCCGSLCKGVLVSTIFSGLSLTGAQTCRPLCSFDAQYTQSCQISRWYSASLLQRLRGDSVWGEIAAQGLTCESLNGSACENATLCRISGAGCATDRAWIARKLASPVWQGGAGLGAQKCGLLGQMMAREGECIELQSEADCAGYNGTAGCLWDPGRASCGIPPATVLALLRQEQSLSSC